MLLWADNSRLLYTNRLSTRDSTDYTNDFKHRLCSASLQFPQSGNMLNGARMPSFHNHTDKIKDIGLAWRIKNQMMPYYVICHFLCSTIHYIGNNMEPILLIQVTSAGKNFNRARATRSSKTSLS